ncbi:methyltransferase [Actinokineospora enzanensis]|uniref:methyltransferase n=1 Tax=Actinokineospora enzanensis TaxID=155975 RepID=UPI00037342F4|nr:methyltransferase [Actinokineospora enzanensis]
METDQSPRARIARLVDGYQATQLLFVAVDLDLAERLAAGPRTAAEIAPETGVAPGTLHRVLRGLAALGVFEELGEGRFGLGELGHLLRADAPGSVHGLLLVRGGLYYRSYDHFRESVREGGTAFERFYGSKFFDYLNDHPETGEVFQLSMTARSRHEAIGVTAAYDFGRFDSLVDVGGGEGVLLAAIAAASPDLRAVLFDQPDVVARATDLPANCEVIGGDFFGDIPAGADAYLLSRVIHDWDDAEAVTILTACRKAIPDHGTLVLVEALLPERAIDAPAAVRMDVSMLAMFGGRERTEAEFTELLASTGFALERVALAEAELGLYVLEARPV